MFHQSTIAVCILDDGRYQRYDNFRYLRSTSIRPWAENGVNRGVSPSERFSQNELARGRGGLNEEEGVSCAWFACVEYGGCAQRSSSSSTRTEYQRYAKVKERRKRIFIEFSERVRWPGAAGNTLYRVFVTITVLEITNDQKQKDAQIGLRSSREPLYHRDFSFLLECDRKFP